MYYIYKHHHTLFSIEINNNMEHQDWKQVILNRSTEVNRSHVLDRSTQEYSKAKKIADETENVKHTQVGLSLGKKIQNARMAGGFTSQKALAQAINVKPDVIMSYESGKAIPDNMIMQKLRRVLKTKL
jgi:putative transcription factor